jgi:eukaryotic-like serine/threonine-protein kinase
MAHIFLTEKGKQRGKMELPPELEGDNGGRFRLGWAKKATKHGTVFKAQFTDAESGAAAECAVKVLAQQDDVPFDRFQNEIRIMRMLNHKYIARFLDAGTVDLEAGYRAPWIAMELAEMNLREHVQDRGVLGPKSIISVGTQMCEAFEHMHSKGIIHRDIKPQNFVIVGPEVRMIDFGIAKLKGEDVSARPMDDLTRTQDFVGPVFFSSPELIAYASNKDTSVDHRSDLFQMGKVLWFAATGQISAGVPSVKKCPHGGAFHAIIMNLLSDDPSDRPSSANKVREQLLPLLK